MSTTDRISVSAPDAAAGNPVQATQAAATTTPSANPPAAPKAVKKNKGIRQTLAFSSDIVGIPPLLNSVANVNVSIPQRLQPNFYFPSALAFFQTVSACDRAMVATKKFLDGTESWTPFTSQYYASLLFYLQVFRTYSKSGIPDQAGFDFVDMFEANIDLKNIAVPGPWVPFIRSLSVVEAHHESFANIAPILPAIVSSPLTAQGHYSWLTAVNRTLPNPLLPMDQTIALANWARTDANPAFISYRNVMGLTLSSVTDTNNVFQLLLGPTASSWSAQSRGRTMTTWEFWNDNRRLLPTRLAHDYAGANVVDSYLKLFGLENLDNSRNHGFFDVIKNDMALYCQFFKGSVPLSTIDVVGSGAGIPRHSVRDEAATSEFFYPSYNQLSTRRHAQGHRMFPTDMQFNMSHGDLSLDTVDEQYSMSTLINTDIGTVTAPPGHNPVVSADLVEGPFWDITVMRRARRFSPIPSYSTVIPAYYHVTTPVTPKTL